MWDQIATYSLLVLILLLCVPYMRHLFYESSKDLIKSLEPYKRPWLTHLMQFFSVAGDGDCYFYALSILFAMNKNYDFIFLVLCLALNLHWNNTLKMGIHDSRPQFDDPSIATINAGTCAGEFGNPSGHALITSQYFTSGLLFCLTEYKSFFESNRVLKNSLKVFCVIFTLGVLLCRIYLGRHSIDQILLGATLGSLTAHFLHYCFKPHMFDPIFRPPTD